MKRAWGSSNRDGDRNFAEKEDIFVDSSDVGSYLLIFPIPPSPWLTLPI
jgi:hypothetical protein